MFQNPVDIANRGLQHVGADLINDADGFEENSQRALHCEFVYDKLRRAELRRNVWRFAIRTVILRAIDADTMLLTPTLWSAATTYYLGDLVSTVDNVIWQSVSPSNINNEPGNSSAWQVYFGPMAAAAYDAASSYSAGELVYVADGDGNNQVFLSMVSGNEDDPQVPTAYDAAAIYHKNQIVTSASVLYISLVSLNQGNTPASSPSQWSTTIVQGSGSLKWRRISATLSEMLIAYPLGAGPAAQSTTRNVYRLPAGFLRKAPKDPKMGSSTWSGAPTGLTYDDWNFEGDFITSSEVGPLFLRFVADIAHVPNMDDLFCEALAAKIGEQVCEILTQSSSKVQVCMVQYRQAVSDARIVNGIETGPEESPEDDFIACRA